MSQGRCSGCGETGPEVAIVIHTVSCPDFAALYREHPDRALLPAREYQRWREQDKAGETAVRVAAKISDTDARRAAMADRFRTRDILEDDLYESQDAPAEQELVFLSGTEEDE